MNERICLSSLNQSSRPAVVDISQQPLVLHVINHLITGGLENGLVNLINWMPPERYRHAIVCIKSYSSFRDRIQRPDVPVIALNKGGRLDIGVYCRFLDVIRGLKPAIVHTRNLPSLEFQAIARWAGIAGRIHGEHGRDVYDLTGSRLRYRILRKGIDPLIHRYVAVSVDLSEWLSNTIGVTRKRVTQINNGVDVRRFYPRNGCRTHYGPPGFLSKDSFVVGTVGRMQPVKDPLNLVEAFVRLLERDPSRRSWLRLVMAGDGPLRQTAIQLLRRANAESIAWLPGERVDIPDILRSFDLFILPSIAEGLSNTILEAMASGLPVIATRVGGNPDLVDDGRTGTLVTSSNSDALAAGIASYLNNRNKLSVHGAAAHEKACSLYRMDAMVERYLAVYDEVLRSKKSSTLTAQVGAPKSRKRPVSFS